MDLAPRVAVRKNHRVWGPRAKIDEKKARTPNSYTTCVYTTVTFSYLFMIFLVSLVSFFL